MKIILTNGKHRVIISKCGVYNDSPCYILTFKVQVRILFFWVTVKEFRELDYDDDANFCRSEAIELYNKIVNPYGTV